MSDLDDLVNREYDETTQSGNLGTGVQPMKNFPKCSACNDGDSLAQGWQCNICGRQHGQADDQWNMEEWQNTPPYDPTMNKGELKELEQRFRKFIEFVDLRDSQSIANARTHDWSTMLLGQHEKNKKVLHSCLAHIIAVKGRSDVK